MILPTNGRHEIESVSAILNDSEEEINKNEFDV